MVACPYLTCRGTTLMSSIVDQLTELYVFVDDFLTTHPAVAQWRQSPHDTPDFADAEVLTLALLQGCLGVASLKQTYRLVAHNYRSAFPQLCSYPQWMARLQALAAPISALLSSNRDSARESEFLPDRCQAAASLPSSAARARAPAARRRRVLGQDEQGLVLWI